MLKLKTVDLFTFQFQENSINKLYSQVEAHDNQRFPQSELTPQNFGDAFLGTETTGTTLQSLLENFGTLELEQQSGWPPAPVSAVPGPGDMAATRSPMKFPSQILSQSSRASPFSDTTESSSLFSNYDLPQSQYSAFSSNSLMSSQSSVGGGKMENCLGLSDISSRLEELSQGSMIMSQQSCSTRDSTPLSWNPIVNYSSSKTSSLTSSPIMSGHIKNLGRPNGLAAPEEDRFFSSDEDENLVKIMKNSSTSQLLQQQAHDKIGSLRNAAKPKLMKSVSTVSCVPEAVSPAASAGPTSWSQIVRTSSSKLPSLPGPAMSPVSAAGPVTRSRMTPSPTAKETVAVKEPQLVVEEVPPTTNTVDFHRGPKVDPRWPVSHQVFLGPIPMSITWDEIRNVFYTKVQRRELLHFYVQSKPVNEVVYGQVVFDKPALANKVVKDGPVKVMTSKIYFLFVGNLYYPISYYNVLYLGSWPLDKCHFDEGESEGGEEEVNG